MGRRTAARVVPTAEAAALVCSSSSALVFTPVVPVDSVGDDRESGAAPRARDQEDGKQYVLRVRYREDGKQYALQPVSHVVQLKNDAVFFLHIGRSR